LRDANAEKSVILETGLLYSLENEILKVALLRVYNS